MRFAPIPESLPTTAPFVGPETQERARGAPYIARIGANENGFGPSPRAIEAMAKAAPDIWKYGDSEAHELRVAVAEHHGVAPENIAIGEGIDGLLGLLVRLLVAPGDPVVTSDGAYPTFNFHVLGFGGDLVKVPYSGDYEHPDALLTRAAEVSPRLIYIANPDNPMGSWHDAGVIEAMLPRIPKGSLLILDEAYAEFAPASAIPEIDANDARVIRMRTFSKAYAMAGARVAYAIGAPELIAGFDRIRNHFGVNRVGQAGALAAFQDREWLRSTVAQVSSARLRIGQIASDNGLTALPSATNFVAIDCGHDGAFARAVLTGLDRMGIFVRMPGVAPLNRCIRVSCGPDAALDAFAAALPEALDFARAQQRAEAG
ncbi:pyridoxal phosphate-dependent aminotransferase [Paracoccus sp. SCSIO 75233]|uniref:pyridoxal phosphate-dependent aminotransferase n=1 Tax=Paracoccus sp. SCSIO 75233 TaxID=3017782 RepID=UPI0022F0CE3B|nr:pyridoxal phosphate-dependent aminotransferase [Paracoccus sp. SCSIO 75233]WBU53417.1 pyridoxal phosphate-dependent aminotransferase [Paracoccus sp. SCSIO 75233]